MMCCAKDSKLRWICASAPAMMLTLCDVNFPTASRKAGSWLPQKREPSFGRKEQHLRFFSTQKAHRTSPDVPLVDPCCFFSRFCAFLLSGLSSASVRGQPTRADCWSLREQPDARANSASETYAALRCLSVRQVGEARSLSHPPTPQSTRRQTPCK